MTVTTTSVSSGPYMAAAQTTFAVTFPSLSADEIEVTLDGVALDPSAYTFNRDADGTGDVVTDVPVTGVVYINSVPEFKQQTAFARYGSFYPDMFNKPLDDAALRDQYLLRRIEQLEALGIVGPPGDISKVATRTELAAIVATHGMVRYLTEAGREGIFVFDGTSHTGDVTGDPYQGLFVAPASNATGGSGAWVRRWDGITAQASWFGAVAGIGYDSLPHIHSALANALVVQLSKGDYQVNSRVKIPEHRTLRGAGPKYNDIANRATRLMVNSGTDATVQLGPDAFPGNINLNWQDCWLEDVYVGRLINPVISSGCAGVIAQFTLYGGLKNVKSAESMCGFRYRGTVGLYVDIGCEAVRAQPGTGGGTDYFVGHHVDGSQNIGTNGGNASLSLARPITNCNRTALQTAVGTAGILIDGAFGFTDTFIYAPESTHCRIAIQVEGNGAAGNDLRQTNLRIEHPIMDQFHTAGIYLSAVGEAGAIEIVDPYCGPGTDARACFWFNNTDCAVSIDGGMLVMGGAPAVQPFLIDGASNVTISPSTKVLEAGATYPIVQMTDATNCRIEPTVKNRSVTADAIVQMNGACAANVVAPMASGKASAFTYGIKVVGTGDVRNEYNVSGIDSSALAAPGATRKLDRNGTAVTAVGLTGSNYATGVFT